MKTYKNISTVEQLGIQPGETGEVEIPKDQEDRLVMRGAIEIVGDAQPETSPETPEAPVPDDEVKAAAEAEAKAKADAEAKAGQRPGGRR